MIRVLPGHGRPDAPLLSLLLVLAGLTACTESPLTEVDPEKAPGATSPTREVLLSTFQLPEWRDTSFVGFALPGEGGTVVVSGSGELQSRLLGRFSTIPDSVFIFADTMNVAVDSFLNASVQVRMDTTAATFPEPPFTLRLFTLSRSFDELSVTWTEAAAGVPWTTPGGDLDVELGSAVVEERTDTVTLALQVAGDSLLDAWRETDGEPGVALLAEGTSVPLRVRQMTVRFDVQPEGDRNTVLRNLAPVPSPFIYDPAQPEVGSSLRTLGLPAWRFYVVFRLPETLGGIPLRDATINHARLVFRPLGAPPASFVPSQALVARGVQLLGDPFQQGPKTPIGPVLPGFIVLDPDSLAVGRPLEVDVTTLVSEQALSDDPPSSIRIAIRGQPDAQDFGFWDFGSAEHPNPLARPQLLVILTPPPSFEER
ncbi:MAG: hypothetical protein ACE5HP_05060 [Gemmatimonadota bacterium]